MAPAFVPVKGDGKDPVRPMHQRQQGSEQLMADSESLKALCAEYGWTHEHDRMLRKGPMLARPVIEGGWGAWLRGDQRCHPEPSARAAIEWCEGVMGIERAVAVTRLRRIQAVGVAWRWVEWDKDLWQGIVDGQVVAEVRHASKGGWYWRQLPTGMDNQGHAPTLRESMACSEQGERAN